MDGPTAVASGSTAISAIPGSMVREGVVFNGHQWTHQRYPKVLYGVVSIFLLHSVRIIR